MIKKNIKIIYLIFMLLLITLTNNDLYAEENWGEYYISYCKEQNLSNIFIEEYI